MRQSNLISHHIMLKRELQISWTIRVHLHIHFLGLSVYINILCWQAFFTYVSYYPAVISSVAVSYVYGCCLCILGQPITSSRVSFTLPHHWRRRNQCICLCNSGFHRYRHREDTFVPLEISLHTSGRQETETLVSVPYLRASGATGPPMWETGC